MGNADCIINYQLPSSLHKSTKIRHSSFTSVTFHLLCRSYSKQAQDLKSCLEAWKAFLPPYAHFTPTQYLYLFLPCQNRRAHNPPNALEAVLIMCKDA